MKILGIIPARGGSKGIPRKNLIPLAGKPLIYHTIRAAQGSRRLTRTILSSDDVEICTVARDFGVDVPFTRPADLATDRASSLKVAQHALQFVEEQEGTTYDLACLLQLTGPKFDTFVLDTGQAHLFHLTLHTTKHYIRSAGFDVIECELDGERTTSHRHLRVVARKPVSGAVPDARVPLPPGMPSGKEIRRTLRRQERALWLRDQRQLVNSRIRRSLKKIPGAHRAWQIGQQILGSKHV